MRRWRPGRPVLRAPGEAARPQARHHGLRAEQGRLEFLFDAARKPGLYRFELTLRDIKGPAGAQPRTEQRAYIFNVDTLESDLRRAAKEDLERTGALLRNPGTGWGTALADRQSDLSESAWFYLLFLVVLIIEQALAVHLSFHIRGGISNEAQLPTQVLRSQGVAG